MDYNDVNFNILLHLSYADILNICQVSKDINNICHDEHFWQVKYIQDFNSHVIEHESWQDAYEYMYLLNLDYNQLINIKNDMINDDFWHDKYDRDFVFGNYIKRCYTLGFTWKKLYQLSNNVYNKYPALIYPFSLNDLNYFYQNNVPLLKSPNINDLRNTITENIHVDSSGACVNVNGKVIALYNFYNDKMSLYTTQELYESAVKRTLEDFIVPILEELHIGDFLIIYNSIVPMFTTKIWGIITHTNFGYELSHYKSYPGVF
jgi:hypothetical protein